MNLSPLWIGELAKDGHDTIHWREVGSPGASDDDILAWATENERKVLTADRDFAAAVATRRLSAPSIVQLRTDSTDPVVVGEHLRGALKHVERQLSGGTILTVDDARTRFRPGPHTFSITEEK